jgi:2-keto-3-deoxy-L-fuconate dehydrogenase
MTSSLAGKNVLLTAAGQGIGRATALAFAREGAAVWATDVNQTTLGTLAVEYSQIRTRTIDVRDTPGIETLVAEVGKIDVLFNCAGYVHHGTILDCSVEDWTFSTDLNLKSCTALAQAIPYTYRAAGTSLSGQALSDSVLIQISRIARSRWE